MQMRFAAMTAAVVAFTAGSVSAGTLSATINQNIFGSSYTIDIYRVGGDLAGTAGRLEPEGLVFHNGVLYASGDGASAETNGFLAAYAGGNLGAAPTTFGPYAVSGIRVGGEGITVNTRGSGYGAFASGSAPRLVTVDNPGGVAGRILGVQDTAPVGMSDVQTNFAVNSDDVTYVPGATAADDRYAFLNGGSVPPSVVWYNTAAVPAPTGQTGFNLPLGAKGLLFLSAADAALFDPSVTQDAFLVASSPDSGITTNRLSLYTIGGTLISESVLATGGGQVGRFGNIEGLAFDTETKRLFIADETTNFGQIAVLTIPAPGAVGVMGLAVLAAARRRR